MYMFTTEDSMMYERSGLYYYLFAHEVILTCPISMSQRPRHGTGICTGLQSFRYKGWEWSRIPTVSNLWQWLKHLTPNSW